MAKVVKAFDDGVTMLPATDVDYMAAGPGDSIWTTIERGSDYAAIPIWNADIKACVLLLVFLPAPLCDFISVLYLHYIRNIYMHIPVYIYIIFS